MKTAWLVGQKVGHFVAVLFLSSLVLAGLLWFSPGSPGKARDLVDWDTAQVGQEVCVETTTCGFLRSMPKQAADDPTEDDGFNFIKKFAEVELEEGTKSIESGRVLRPGPSFPVWFFGVFWKGVLIWDIGPAFNGDPVLEVVLLGAKQTLPIVFGALFVAVLVTLLLVSFLTWLPFPSMRGLLRTVLLVVSISPVFVLGFLMTKAGVLPHPVNWWVAPLACVAILFVGDSSLGEFLLQLENEFRQLRNRDYIHAAGLRGASLFKHMLPGLLLPLSSMSAAKIGFLLGSVVIAENIYAVQGLGTLSLKAATKPDPLLLLTLTVFITGVVALVTLVRDLLEIFIDPRIRKAGGH
ncbi:MAG: ABC transporter permease subunit [Deltaproteobacteria bacterium]|nr:ABC transporter permease subunit [Deltaproteobacteria bacterium]